MLLEGKEIIGAVDINENEIEHLLVNIKYQNKGYGTKLLKFAVSHIQHQGIKKDIVLCVADINKEAVQLYLKNGFKCVNTFTDNW